MTSNFVFEKNTTMYRCAIYLNKNLASSPIKRPKVYGELLQGKHKKRKPR